MKHNRIIWYIDIAGGPTWYTFKDRKPILSTKSWSEIYKLYPNNKLNGFSTFKFIRGVQKAERAYNQALAIKRAYPEATVEVCKRVKKGRRTVKYRSYIIC